MISKTHIIKNYASSGAGSIVELFYNDLVFEEDQKLFELAFAKKIEQAQLDNFFKNFDIEKLGERKSTLAVLSMMQGFEYVADDYLVLEKNGDELHSFPIYSIITLSHLMHQKLRHELKGEFVSNNARRDKYVIDIKAYHENFREKYAIKLCMFPQIVADAKPSIVPCKKGRAITQLVHSTISQMEDKHDIQTIRKLVSFIRNFNFYQINLSSDIKANVECLRQFLTNYDEL